MTDFPLQAVISPIYVCLRGWLKGCPPVIPFLCVSCSLNVSFPVSIPPHLSSVLRLFCDLFLYISCFLRIPLPSLFRLSPVSLLSHFCPFLRLFCDLFLYISCSLFVPLPPLSRLFRLTPVFSLIHSCLFPVPYRSSFCRLPVLSVSCFRPFLCFRVI